MTAARPTSTTQMLSKINSKKTSPCYTLTGNLNPHIPHVTGDPFTGLFVPACFSQNGLNSIIAKCEAAAQKSGVAQAFVGFTPVLYVSDPGLAWQVTEKIIAKKIFDGEAGGVQRKVFGLGTVLSRSSKDPVYQKTIGNLMRQVMGALNQLARPMSEILKPFLQEIESSIEKGTAIDVENFTGRISLTMISQTQLGFHDFPEKDKNELIDLAHEVMERLINPINAGLIRIEDAILHFIDKKRIIGRFAPYLSLTWNLDKWIKKGDAVLHRVIERNLVKNLEKIRELSGNPEFKQEDLTSFDAISVMKLVLIGGFETTQKLLRHCFLELSDTKNAENIKKIQAEIKNKNTDPADWTLKDLDDLVHLRAFIYEILRRYPPFSHTRVYATEDFELSQNVSLPTNMDEFHFKKASEKKADYAANLAKCDESDNIKVPAGTFIIVSKRATAHKNSDQIILERWLKYDEQNRAVLKFNLEKPSLYFNPFFTTFGGDERMCPGRKFSELEACIVFAKIISSYSMQCDLSHPPLAAGFTLELPKGVKPMMKFARITPKEEKEYQSEFKVRL